MQYDAIYQNIVKFVRANGVAHIYHKKLEHKGLCGYFDQSKNAIYIDTGQKNTHAGCFYLLHEYVHFKQWKSGKYKRFFNITTDIPKHKQRTLLEYVAVVEQETDEEAMWLLWNNWSVFFDAKERALGHDENMRWWGKHFFKDETLMDPAAE